jgi:hypothetical protein
VLDEGGATLADLEIVDNSVLYLFPKVDGDAAVPDAFTVFVRSRASGDTQAVAVSSTTTVAELPVKRPCLLMCNGTPLTPNSTLASQLIVPYDIIYCGALRVFDSTATKRVFVVSAGADKVGRGWA